MEVGEAFDGGVVVWVLGEDDGVLFDGVLWVVVL